MGLENFSLNESLEKFAKMQNNLSGMSHGVRHTSPAAGSGGPEVEKILRDEIREKDDQILSMSRQITEVNYSNPGFQENHAARTRARRKGNRAGVPSR